MGSRRNIVFLFVLLLVIASIIVDAKKAKKGKARKKRETVVKYEKSCKGKEKEDLKETVKSVVPDASVDEKEEVLLPPYQQPKTVMREQNSQHIPKPRSLKIQTAYEQCKLECKRKRDELSADEKKIMIQRMTETDLLHHISQLREELAQAEAALAEQKLQAKTAARQEEAVTPEIGGASSISVGEEQKKPSLNKGDEEGTL